MSANSFKKCALALMLGLVGTAAMAAAPTTVVVAFPAGGPADTLARVIRSEEHTSELQSLMRISYAVFCLQTKTMKLEGRVITTLHATKVACRNYVSRVTSLLMTKHSA